MASPLTPAQPHIQSFNQFMDETLAIGVTGVPPQKFVLEGPSKERLHVSFCVASVNIGHPTVLDDDFVSVIHLTPRESRECKVTYSAPMDVTFECCVDGRTVEIFTRSIGHLPLGIEEKWVNLESGGLSLNSALSRWIDCNCHRRILNMVDTLL
mmetsp:Transcript_6260/g.21361  ORF Transcript_6260/g.21361 Transcript_6260/m.21361 type:complete len:154 (-) Transcript_6260:3547-4008(-)